MMWDYWEKWHRQPHRCGEPSDNPLLNNLQCSYAPDGPMFTPEFMASMRRAFEEAERRAKSDEILARAKRAKLSLLYLELSQHLGYYTEFGDFVYGKSLRQNPAAKQLSRPLLDEFTEICKKHELTTLGIPVTLAKITAKWQSCLAADSAALPKIYLPAEWIFRPDPADKGVGEKWCADPKSYEAAQQLDGGSGRGQTSTGPLAAGLHRLHINRGVGWEQQGFAGFDGYGWCFQNIEIPDELLSKKHLYLGFLQVNEQAWVYLNGELACERSYASTGKGVGQLGAVYQMWDDPRRANPHLWIDDSASGGRRVDLEAVSRALVLWRSDNTCDMLDHSPKTIALPDEQEGMVMAFRRDQSPYASCDCCLRDIDSAATYQVRMYHGYDPETPITRNGFALQRLNITIGERPGSVLVEYEELK